MEKEGFKHKTLEIKGTSQGLNGIFLPLVTLIFKLSVMCAQIFTNFKLMACYGQDNT